MLTFKSDSSLFPIFHLINMGETTAFTLDFYNSATSDRATSKRTYFYRKLTILQNELIIISDMSTTSKVIQGQS